MLSLFNSIIYWHLVEGLEGQFGERETQRITREVVSGERLVVQATLCVRELAPTSKENCISDSYNK